MPKRPLAVTLIGWMFITAGVVGLAYHANEFDPRNPLRREFLLVSGVRLLAIVIGTFVLRGRNWARWLAIVWLGYHVALSAFHSPAELGMHAVLFAGVLHFLFRPKSAAWFQGAAKP